ncbi:MAG: RNA 2',3'-cyclic phosphodiesterase [Candidatus Binatia bacterium]
MIRTFVGIRIDPEMAGRISEVQFQLERSLKGIRWVGKENLHFTFKFLGDVQEEKVVPIVGALERVLSAIPSFPIYGGGLGVFPDIKRARILWVGLEGETLRPLLAKMETTFERIGFARDKRSFKPHLTIGRWRHFDRKSELLKGEIEKYRDCDFGETQVKEVVFFQSVLQREGAVYMPLRVIALSNRPRSTLAF